MAKAKASGGKNKKKGKMSAKKGKAKESEEELLALKAAALKKLKADYPIQCKKFISEPIPAVIKRIDKSITAMEDIDKVRPIIIPSYTIIPNEIWALYYTFETYPYLTALCLWTSPIDARGLDAIAKFVIHHPTLTILHLIDCKITPSMTPHLTHILKDSKTLTTLVLDHNGIGSLGAVNVFMGIRANPANPGILKNLSMRYCDIGSKAADAIAITIATNNGLIDIDLSGNQIGDEGFPAIAKALPSNTTLKSLRLCANNIQNREMGYSAYQPPPPLTQLQQRNGAAAPSSPVNPLSLNTSINTLCNVLAGAEGTGLALLDLSGNHIGTPGGEAVLEMLRQKKPLAQGKKCEALQVEISERMGDELYSTVCDVNDVMADIAVKNAKGAKGKGKGKGKKGKK
ncbi:hypothetical protein HDU79_000981 [Rhizoclosmatium sp. JEL0117]|nr:hypothetical protein HDU79_000981 [Rhizoclosmatium sp. JEL0117]